jgi:hypothetical protein
MICSGFGGTGGGGSSSISKIAIGLSERKGSDDKISKREPSSELLSSSSVVV